MGEKLYFEEPENTNFFGHTNKKQKYILRIFIFSSSSNIKTNNPVEKLYFDVFPCKHFSVKSHVCQNCGDIYFYIIFRNICLNILCII